jgi:hypothetical protein
MVVSQGVGDASFSGPQLSDDAFESELFSWNMRLFYIMVHLAVHLVQKIIRGQEVRH